TDLASGLSEPHRPLDPAPRRGARARRGGRAHGRATRRRTGSRSAPPRSDAPGGKADRVAAPLEFALSNHVNLPTAATERRRASRARATRLPPTTGGDRGVDAGANSRDAGRLVTHRPQRSRGGASTVGPRHTVAAPAHAAVPCRGGTPFRTTRCVVGGRSEACRDNVRERASGGENRRASGTRAVCRGAPPAASRRAAVSRGEDQGGGPRLRLPRCRAPRPAHAAPLRHHADAGPRARPRSAPGSPRAQVVRRRRRPLTPGESKPAL